VPSKFSLTEQWKQYKNSYDKNYVVVQSKPILTISIVVIMISSAIFVYFREHLSLNQALFSSSLAFIAGIFSLLTWKFSYKSKNTISLFQAIDTTLYSLFAVSIVFFTKFPVSFVFLTVYFLMCNQYAGMYSFSLFGTFFIVVIPFIYAIVDIIITSTLYENSYLILFLSINFVFYLNKTWVAKERKLLKSSRKRAYSVLEDLDNIILTKNKPAGEDIDISVMIHDLKNKLGPANLNLGYISSIMENVKKNEGKIESDDLNETLETIKDIEQSISKTISIIMEFLTKNEDKDKNRLPKGVLLSELQKSLQNTENKLTDTLQTRFLNIKVKLPEIKVKGSIRGLQLVLNNLIDNALGAGATKIKINGKILGGRNTVSIMISDNGSGLHPDAKSNIFDKFYTFGKENGTGLGLFLSKNIINSFGGTIELFKTDKKGVTFLIELPII
jgi:signal transduction histidine kinase